MLNKKIKLFIFQPYPKFGGADRSIIKLINGLNFTDITLISISRCNYSKYLNKKITYKKLNSKRVIFSIFELRNFIKKNLDKSEAKKNIIISNQNFANIITTISLLKLKKIKKILIERNHLDELKHYKNFHDYLKKKIILYLIKYFYSKSDAIIGISKKLSKDLELFIKSKVITIYNPSLEDKIINNNPNKININYSKKIILSVGYLEKQKDHLTILKSINILKNKYNNFILVIVGKGNEYNNLKSYIKINKLNGYVKIYKTVNNPTFFYKKANLFILSSIYEGLGNVLVEALKNKCPVITSSCNSGPLEIISNGKYGDYFKPKDFNTLARKIEKHFQNPSRLKNKSIKSLKFLKKFSLKNNINRFLNLFKNI